MNIKQAKQVCGSDLGKASKMPGFGYGISAKDCQTGAQLAKVPGSVCSDCYALKGNYIYPSVKLSHKRRLNSINTDLNAWIGGMVHLIAKRVDPKVPYFRWHDSGDLQSLDHLKAIVTIAKYFPQIAFWLPTKEKKYVLAFISEGGEVPQNLAIRLSASMKDQKAKLSNRLKVLGMQSSQAFSNPNMDDVASCPASLQDDECKDCRKCWDKTIPCVTYKVH